MYYYPLMSLIFAFVSPTTVDFFLDVQRKLQLFKITQRGRTIGNILTTLALYISAALLPRKPLGTLGKFVDI